MTIYRTFQSKRISQPNGKIPLPKKEDFLELYQNQNISRKELATYYGVHKGTIDNWCKLFELSKTKEQQVSIALRNYTRCDREGLYSEKVFEDNPHLKIKTGKFYIIKMFNDTECFYKCGITKNSVRIRYRGRLKNYEYEIISEETMCLYDAYKLEKIYKQTHKHISYTPKYKFAGHTECYISQEPETQAKS